MGETISLDQRRQESWGRQENEQAIREDLAAVHRLAHRFGWDDNIFNHFFLCASRRRGISCQSPWFIDVRSNCVQPDRG